jgi:hypothetical protein
MMRLIVPPTKAIIVSPSQMEMICKKLITVNVLPFSSRASS